MWDCGTRYGVSSRWNCVARIATNCSFFRLFLSSRPNEQIYNNATEGKKIIYATLLAALLPAGPGHSHQGVRDIASILGIPNMTIIETD